MALPPARLNCRIGEVCSLAGISRWKVRQKMESGEIRWRRDGRDIYLHPADVELGAGNVSARLNCVRSRGELAGCGMEGPWTCCAAARDALPLV
jgi:hypothetical protein